ncbi:MAG: hypothetical protein Q8L23_06175 [Caulobacter sp.]|nr:hypothetical protein [Caulobacter sp.]
MTSPPRAARLALLGAAALAFDLGVMVVAGHAVEAPKTPESGAPSTVRKAGTKSDDYLKIKLTDVLVSSYAIDRTHTARGCEIKHGKVVEVAGMPMCQLPAAPVAK